ncbi:MAG: hypothetical protein ACOYT4_01830 [Nanoarchaeota archaeon]
MKRIYAATPFRMERLINNICDFIESQGHFPIHPFLALPLERYNYERYPKEEIYQVCFDLVGITDELWIFGIGTGALTEYRKAKELKKPVKSYIKVFDSDWEERFKEKEFERYQKNFGEILDEVIETSIIPTRDC